MPSDLTHPPPQEGLCLAHQDTTPLPYDHAISEMANQIFVLIGLATIFPCIVLWKETHLL